MPKHIYNPDENIVEFKIAHNDISLYAYYRVVDGGVIAGRYYEIATVDIDNDNTTGYWLHGGGYHPTAPRFDGNFEVEFFNGSFNQDYYLDHAANNNTEVNYLKHENKKNQFMTFTRNTFIGNIN
ncbi:unnamed protein product [Adineta steineri]|uniref:Uncharacterized protein n=1 Tax=Adineta steineri TaxID=433720 RepID=A0A814XY13_9BILA|nr:unnamed protein product [Adineta steineri]CAF4146097.1 unnamed protein product [Adineta steineri]